MTLSTDDRDQQLERMEQAGTVHPDCETCQSYFYTAENPANVFAPNHTASPRCESGKHSHCSCDTCF